MNVPVPVYQALVVAKGLKFYARTGKPVNRDYTPKNMMALASKITGRPFKAEAYMEAHDALMEWVRGPHS